MKVSIITVVFNGEQYIEDCIQSVLMQTHQDIEYIVIDGASTDQTLPRIKKYADQIDQIVSEPDKGMYDAINKGIAMATGEIIGLLNADDMLADLSVIERIAATFKLTEADAVYGDLNYVGRDKLNIIRKWKGKQHSLRDLEFGWMPAHPTFYLKRSLLQDFGGYSLNMGSAADYEFMLKMLYTHRLHGVYLPMLLVNMRTGGQSNATITNRMEGLKNDYNAIRLHQLPHPFFTILLKKVRKISQFI